MKGLSLCLEVCITQQYQQRAVTGSALFPQYLDTSSHSCKLAITRVSARTQREWGHLFIRVAVTHLVCQSRVEQKEV